jgi:PmbA protein
VPALDEVAARIAASAIAGEQLEAYVGWSRETEVRAYEADIEHLSSAESAGVGVRVIMGERVGFAYVGSLDETAAKEALEEARDNATFASVDEHAGLAHPDGVEAHRLELWDDELAGVPTDAKTGYALDLEGRIRGLDPRIRQVVEANYSDSAHEFAVATSTGIAASGRRTRCWLSAEVIAEDGDGPQTAYAYSVGRAPSQLDADRTAREAVARAVRMLGARKPASETLTVVFDRRVTSMLLGIVAQSLSGEEVAKGRSMFAGRIGEDVAVPEFELLEDPTDESAYGAAECDSEGLACRPTTLIGGGRLEAFLYDTRAARMAGTSSTGSAVRAGYRGTPRVGARALVLGGGELDEEAILARVGSGLFVQTVKGVHSGVNPVSGDFSVGAEGLLIRDGTLADPVREITVASTLQRMLQHVVSIGGDRDWVPGNACGVTVAIGDMSMSGA